MNPAAGGLLLGPAQVLAEWLGFSPLRWNRTVTPQQRARTSILSRKPVAGPLLRTPIIHDEDVNAHQQDPARENEPGLSYAVGKKQEA